MRAIQKLIAAVNATMFPRPAPSSVNWPSLDLQTATLAHKDSSARNRGMNVPKAPLHSVQDSPNP